MISAQSCHIIIKIQTSETCCCTSDLYRNFMILIYSLKFVTLISENLGFFVSYLDKTVLNSSCVKQNCGFSANKGVLTLVHNVWHAKGNSFLLDSILFLSPLMQVTHNQWCTSSITGNGPAFAGRTDVG